MRHSAPFPLVGESVDLWSTTILENSATVGGEGCHGELGDCDPGWFVGEPAIMLGGIGPHLEVEILNDAE